MGNTHSYLMNKKPASTFFIHICLVIVFIVTVYPFFYILSLSVMPYENYMKTPIHLGPSGFTLMYFKQIIADPNLPRAFFLSGVRVLVGASLNVVNTMMCAYVLSRPQVRYRHQLSFLFLIPMYFSAGLIPYYLTIRNLGLMNTFWVMVLPGLVSSMWFFTTRATMLNYPVEILEAAHIDGAGQMRIFWKIIWPTSLPTLATLAMMYGLGHWNEYFMTRILVQKELWTAPVFLYSMMNSKIVLQGLGLGIRLEAQSYLSAIAACLIIPILVAYPFLQRFVISGLTAGAVKG